MDTDFDNEDLHKTHLLVHDIKPPFLDGRELFTSQSSLVIPLRDSTSDFASNSRKGSRLLRTMRQEKERMNTVKERFKIAGTRQGEIMESMKTEEEKGREEEKEKEEEEEKNRSMTIVTGETETAETEMNQVSSHLISSHLKSTHYVRVAFISYVFLIVKCMFG